MSDQNYRRTTGGKHRWKKRAWLPIIGVDGRALMRDGAVYQVRDDGWRLLKASGRKG